MHEKVVLPARGYSLLSSLEKWANGNLTQFNKGKHSLAPGEEHSHAPVYAGG